MAAPPRPVYQDDLVTLYRGDCREIIPTILVYSPAAVGIVVVMDPPYGIRYVTKWREGGGAIWAGEEIEGDRDYGRLDWLIRLLGNDGEALVFAPPLFPIPETARAVLVWDKGPRTGMGNLDFPWKKSHENILVFGDGWTRNSIDVGEGLPRGEEIPRDPSVISGYPAPIHEGVGRLHPTMKPVALMQYLISRTPEDAIILDPFAGSGTTLRAAKDLGRRAIGIEIDGRHARTACRLLAQECLPLRRSG